MDFQEGKEWMFDLGQTAKYNSGNFAAAVLSCRAKLGSFRVEGKMLAFECDKFSMSVRKRVDCE